MHRAHARLVLLPRVLESFQGYRTIAIVSCAVCTCFLLAILLELSLAIHFILAHRDSPVPFSSSESIIAKGPSTSMEAISVSPPSSISIGSVRGQSSGRPQKSLVWEYFDYDPILQKSIRQVLSQATGTDSDTNNVCGSSFAGKFPTNLKKNHLKKSHPTQYTELLSKEKGKRRRRRKWRVLKG